MWQPYCVDFLIKHERESWISYQNELKMALFTLFQPVLLHWLRQNVSPVPTHHQVEFGAYGPQLIGISLMIPTAPTMLACGLAADIFGREQRVVNNTKGLDCPL